MLKIYPVHIVQNIEARWRRIFPQGVLQQPKERKPAVKTGASDTEKNVKVLRLDFETD